MPYLVIITPSANKTIARLPKAVRSRIAERLAALAANPRPVGSVKLTDQDAYRIRIGDYRVIYTIEDQKLVVLIVDVGHRREVYRK